VNKIYLLSGERFIKRRSRVLKEAKANETNIEAPVVYYCKLVHTRPEFSAGEISIGEDRVASREAAGIMTFLLMLTFSSVLEGISSIADIAGQIQKKIPENKNKN